MICVGPSADLLSDSGVWNLVTEMPESLLPGARVQIHGIHQRPVNVEDNRAQHGRWPSVGGRLPELYGVRKHCRPPTNDCFYAAFREDFAGGTFAPLRRALDSPIAIACLRLFTGCFPDFMWRISVRTSFCAFGLYFRPLDFRDLEDDDLRLELLRELPRDREDFLVAAMFTSLGRLPSLSRKPCTT